MGCRTKSVIAFFYAILIVRQIVFFILGSEYYVDMRDMDKALTEAGVEHELIDPLAERNMEMQHCFVASERENEVAKDAFDRMMVFIKHQVR
jgi:aconitase A